MKFGLFTLGVTSLLLKSKLVTCDHDTTLILPYGDSTSDTFTGPNDDSSSVSFSLPQPMLFYNTFVNTVIQNTNGDITFEDPYSRFRPDAIPSTDVPPMMAIYWSDIDTRNHGTDSLNPSENELWARTISSTGGADDTQDLQIIEDYVANCADKLNLTYPFSPDSGFVATWHLVEPYPQGNGGDETLSFQLIAASEGNQTFTIMCYEELEWYISSTSQEAVVGFNGHNGIDGELVTIVDSDADKDRLEHKCFVYKVDDQIIRIPDPPTPSPSAKPSASPSNIPSSTPSTSPSSTPSTSPSSTPSTSPSNSPSASPSNSPSTSPSNSPSTSPSNSPSTSPSNSPSTSPSDSPSTSPTDTPSASPTDTPSASPTDSPSASPTDSPSASPTDSPSASPTDSPSASPSNSPSTSPTDTPSTSPTDTPSTSPTDTPSTSPSDTPSTSPSDIPSDVPSSQPSTTPGIGPQSGYRYSDTETASEPNTSVCDWDINLTLPMEIMKPTTEQGIYLMCTNYTIEDHHYDVELFEKDCKTPPSGPTNFPIIFYDQTNNVDTVNKVNDIELKFLYDQAIVEESSLWKANKTGGCVEFCIRLNNYLSDPPLPMNDFYLPVNFLEVKYKIEVDSLTDFNTTIEIFRTDALEEKEFIDYEENIDVFQCNDDYLEISNPLPLTQGDFLQICVETEYGSKFGVHSIKELDVSQDGSKLYPYIDDFITSRLAATSCKMSNSTSAICKAKVQLIAFYFDESDPSNLFVNGTVKLDYVGDRRLSVDVPLNLRRSKHGIDESRMLTEETATSFGLEVALQNAEDVESSASSKAAVQLLVSAVIAFFGAVVLV